MLYSMEIISIQILRSWTKRKVIGFSHHPACIFGLDVEHLLQKTEVT